MSLLQRVSALLLLATICQLPCNAAVRSYRLIRSRQSSGVSLRKRLHVNDLITEPGTVEIDWSGLYSYTSTTFTMPAAVKYTPAGNSLLFGRTEYSVSFDSVESAINTGVRSTQFSDRLTMTATSIFYSSEHLNLAFAPQLTAFLRDEAGVRIGGTAIARYDNAGHSAAFTAGWSGATHVTDTNPAGVWDLGFGYGKQLAQSGELGKITPHTNLVWEKSSGNHDTWALYGGVEYKATARVAFDLSGQRLGISGVAPDRQVLLSATFNLGRVRE